jgi:AAA15 family ATPase/GTPase
LNQKNKLKKVENQIKNLRIENFKSIKKMDLECSRINIFIGEPNVGKSNILEALALLSPLYSEQNENLNKRFLGEFIRYENIKDIFYDRDVQQRIIVDAGQVFTQVRYQANNIDSAEFFVGFQNWVKNLFSEHLTGNLQSMQHKFQDLQSENFIPILSNGKLSPFEQIYFSLSSEGKLHQNNLSLNSNNPIKKYHFVKNIKTTNQFPLFLTPNGDNLYRIVRYNEELQNFAIDFFERQNLDFLFNDGKLEFEPAKIVKRIKVPLPYSLVADTFQRMLFYMAAIKSNSNSVLVFEEPEVHSFPEYVSMLSKEISKDLSNQYFIATHSPYLLNDIIEQTPPEDLSVFICGYKDYQTYAKKMTSEQLSELLNYGVDIFYNLNSYLDAK